MPNEVDYAVQWLEKMLGRGPILSNKIRDEAQACGIAQRTLWRAKKQLGVRVGKKTTANGPWFWELHSVPRG